MESSDVTPRKRSFIQGARQVVTIIFFGMVMLAGILSIGLDAIMIGKRLGLSNTTGQGLVYWTVGFTYFFNKYYWRRADKNRTNGIVAGAFSAIFVVAVIFAVAIVAAK